MGRETLVRPATLESNHAHHRISCRSNGLSNTGGCRAFATLSSEAAFPQNSNGQAIAITAAAVQSNLIHKLIVGASHSQ